MYAYPAGTSFCSCKRKQNTLGETPRPPTLGCAGYGYCFSAKAEKQIRTARRCAPKVACGGIFIARALEREGRTTSPLPSSKEGDYGAGEQILCNQPLLFLENLAPAPAHRDPFLAGSHFIPHCCCILILTAHFFRFRSGSPTTPGRISSRTRRFLLSPAPGSPAPPALPPLPADDPRKGRQRRRAVRHL